MKKLTFKILFVVVLVISFCLKSQTKNSKMENDWIFFVNSFDFSESFKSELSKQLEEKLYKLNNLDKSQKNPIKLVIGMEKLNQTVTNDYIFSSANIFINETDEMFQISICWKSSDFNDVKEIQKSNLNGKKVEFEWCEDFPFEELKNVLTTEKVYDKVNNLKYLIKAEYYPDLIVNFALKAQLKDDESQIIENIFKKNKKVYVSQFNENSIMLDFQIDTMNFKEEDYYKDIEYLKSSIKEVSELKFSDKIENIEIK